METTADLRALERHEEGLRVLDVAWGLSPTERAERAMLSCAIAIHCDRGHHGVAETLERQFDGTEIDLKFALACLRLYTELVDSTGNDEHSARRDFYRGAVASLEAGDKIVGGFEMRARAHGDERALRTRLLCGARRSTRGAAEHELPLPPPV